MLSPTPVASEADESMIRRWFSDEGHLFRATSTTIDSGECAKRTGSSDTRAWADAWTTAIHTDTRQLGCACVYTLCWSQILWMIQKSWEECWHLLGRYVRVHQDFITTKEMCGIIGARRIARMRAVRHDTLWHAFQRSNTATPPKTVLKLFINNNTKPAVVKKMEKWKNGKI